MDNPVYSSQITGFITWEEPVLKSIYIKNKNETKAKINITKNWKMEGEVYDPWFFIPKRFVWNQKDCEQYILGRIGCNREDTLRRMHLDRYDSILMLYKSRGVKPTDTIWFAWSDDDKFEDYHPKATSESWAEYVEMVHAMQPKFDN